jgi:hypothetical protein
MIQWRVKGATTTMTMTLPRYYIYYSLPVQFLAKPEGGMHALKLDRTTGAFEPGNELIDPITWATTEDVREVTEAAFIEAVERERGTFLNGEGPVFALYGVMNAIRRSVYEEQRAYTPEERVLLQQLSRETHVLFEAELQRRAAEATVPNPAPPPSPPTPPLSPFE